jgi:lipoate-protein ligase A
MRLRMVVDPPARGAWNMAVDEALLESAAGGGPATLRFYQWSEPTLSLGYFQALADRDQHLASRACPLVRRASGGGAILHDRELTYSIAIPVASRFGQAADALYTRVHQSLIETLAAIGVRASLHGGTAPARVAGTWHGASAARDRGAKPARPFLCFQRRTAGDVVAGTQVADKIAGSAQRRQRGALLQHGSILLARSARAPELPGIAELTGVALTTGDLIDRWTPGLLAALEAKRAEIDTLNADEQTLAARLEQDRFGSREWETRR